MLKLRQHIKDTSSALLLCAALLAPIGLTGCQTASNALDNARVGLGMSDTYEDFEGQFITIANDRRKERAEVDQLTAMGEDLGGKKAGADFSYGLDGKRKIKTDTWDDERIANARSIEIYLESLLDKILQHWPYEKPSYKILLIDSDAYSASLEPNGVILVNMGVITNAASEDELAFILAHEASHGLLLHQELDRHVAARREIENRVAMGLLIAMSQSIDGNKFNRQFDPKIAVGYGLYQRIQDDVVSTNWKRHQEDEADLLGLDLMTRAGYNPQAGEVVMDRLQASHEEEVKRAQEAEKAYGQQVKKLMDEGKYGEGTKMMFSKLASAPVVIFSKLFEAVAADHATPESRKENLSGYFSREVMAFAEGSAIPMRTKPVNKLKNRGSSGRVIQKRLAALDATNLLQEGKTEEAEKRAMSALSGGRDSNNALRMVMYKIRKAQGEDKKAYANLKIANRGKHVPSATSLALYDEAVNHNDFKTAEDALDRLDKRPSLASTTIPRRIALYALMGRGQDVKQVYQKCENSEDKELKRNCKDLWKQADTRFKSLRSAKL